MTCSDIRKKQKICYTLYKDELRCSFYDLISKYAIPYLGEMECRLIARQALDLMEGAAKL